MRSQYGRDGTPHFSRNVPQGGTVVEVVLVVVVVVIGNVAAAPHGFGLQVPGPMSMSPFFRHARGLFTRHFGAPLAPAWQHWIGSWRCWRPAEPAARRRGEACRPRRRERLVGKTRTP